MLGTFYQILISELIQCSNIDTVLFNTEYELDFLCIIQVLKNHGTFFFCYFDQLTFSAIKCDNIFIWNLVQMLSAVRKCSKATKMFMFHDNFAPSFNIVAISVVSSIMNLFPYEFKSYLITGKPEVYIARFKVKI